MTHRQATGSQSIRKQNANRDGKKNSETHNQADKDGKEVEEEVEEIESRMRIGGWQVFVKQMKLHEL